MCASRSHPLLEARIKLKFLHNALEALGVDPYVSSEKMVINTTITIGRKLFMDLFNHVSNFKVGILF
jgi:hypothetical protein